MAFLQASPGLLFLGQLLLSSSCLALVTYDLTILPVNITAKSGQTVTLQFQLNVTLNTNENLALKKLTTQSTLYDATTPSSNAVDGVTIWNPSLAYGHGNCAVTMYAANSWLAVDLGQEIRIGRVRITSRTDGHPEQLTDFYIGLTNVSPWTTPPSVPTGNTLCKHNTVHPLDGVPTDIFCEPNTAPGRYLYVFSTAVNHLSICELEAYYN